MASLIFDSNIGCNDGVPAVDSLSYQGDGETPSLHLKGKEQNVDEVCAPAVDSLSYQGDGETPSLLFPGKEALCDHELNSHLGHNQLPHWSINNAIYHVAFRLADAVPEFKRQEWAAERKNIEDNIRQQQREPTEHEKAQLCFLYSDKVNACLDAGSGECLLKMALLAQIVKNSLLYFNGKRYKLHEWCIMPNHVHILVQLFGNYQLSDIVQGWKSFTAHAINKVLNRQGPVWESDFYNHIIRTEKEYYHQKQYIYNNPKNDHWKWRSNGG